MSNTFPKNFSDVAQTQIELERQNEANIAEIKRKYLQLLEYYENRVDEVRANDNIKENINCILKYCSRYIDNIPKWKTTFEITN